MNEDSIRILIADDHAVVREGLSSLISTKPDMIVVGEAADGLEAVQKARVLQPDIILMDMVMPKQSGLQAIQQLKQENNAARIPCTLRLPASLLASCQQNQWRSQRPKSC